MAWAGKNVRRPKSFEKAADRSILMHVSPDNVRSFTVEKPLQVESLDSWCPFPNPPIVAHSFSDRNTGAQSHRWRQEVDGGSPEHRLLRRFLPIGWESPIQSEHLFTKGIFFVSHEAAGYKGSHR
jgi:hypothetical protein